MLGEREIEALFEDSLDRVRRRADAGFENPRPTLDKQLQRNVVEDCIAGRKIDDFRAVLERTRFVYVPAQMLPPYVNGQPHTEGEWRCNRYRLAFSEAEILANFDSPAAFWKFMKELQFKRSKRAA